MDATQHVVKLDPSAVELVDRTMIDLSRDIAMFRVTIERCVRGQPDALLLVEFAGEDHDAQLQQLRRLDNSWASSDFRMRWWKRSTRSSRARCGRCAGRLNIMMSMKGDGKPVSFIEDCAVPLEDLAEYTDRLTKVFHKHGTTGTWYAHASVGCLHVRPILNMKDEQARRKCAPSPRRRSPWWRVQGSHSGEHGDGSRARSFTKACSRADCAPFEE